MTTLDHVIATHQSEWVSFNEEPLFPVPSEGGPKEHLPGASSSSDQSESSSGEHHALDGGSQDLSHSEHDDSSEKLGLISEAASPPGSPEQRPPDLVSAISGWVQFEDDAPWASSSPPPKEAGGTADILSTRGTQGPACLPMDQTQRPQLGPFCAWSPPDADNWPECPDHECLPCLILVPALHCTKDRGFIDVTREQIKK